MPDKQNGMKDDDFVILATDEVRKILPVIISKELPIRRLRANGSYGFIPPADFDNYLKDRDMRFFIDRAAYDLEVVPYIKMVEHPGPIVSERAAPASNESWHDTEFENRYAATKQMNHEERLGEMVRHNHEIEKCISDGKGFTQSVESAERVISDALCINKVTLEENLTSPLPANTLSILIRETQNLIDNMITMIAKGQSSFADLAKLDSIQSGSGTLNHMNRILIRFIAFLFFYNSYFQKNSNEIKKYRAYFQSRFHPYYDKITKGSQRLSLEVAFKDGIMPVRERATFIEYCMGGFLHDVGKMPVIAYHDSHEGFDPSRARRHVFDSYNMLVQSKLFSWGIVSCGLLHHDYYNASFGYRQNATFKSRFKDRRERSRDTAFTRYFVSYNVLDVAYDNAYSYFPNKVMEILDVYDAMTDKDKKYRTKVFEPEEAIEEMRKCYLNGDELGFDPILFNIFVDFLKASKVFQDSGFAERIKV